MITYLRRLVDERNALTGLIHTTTETAAREERDLTEHERGTISQHQERCAQLDTQITEHKAQAESARAWATLQHDLKSLDDEREEVKTGRVVATRAAAPESWADKFVNSRAMVEYRGVGSSERVDVGGLFEARAAIDTTFMTVPAFQFTPGTFTLTTPLLDAVGKQRVSSGNVEWITFPGAYPLAKVVAEGAQKPEADITPAEHSASLQTYAHWKAITRQALDDIPRIRSIIETQLRGGLLSAIETATATALTSNQELREETGPDLLSAIRIGLSEVQEAGYASAKTVLMNPADSAAIDLSIMATAGLVPAVNGRVWGLNIVTAGVVPAGTAYVGDFTAGMTLFDRGVTNVFMTDSHADYFVRNLLLILAESRVLPVVTEPLAIVRVSADDADEQSATNGNGTAKTAQAAR